MDTKNDALMMLESHPVTSIKGVGKKVAEKMVKLGLFTLKDVVLHLPSRYEDRTRLYKITEAPTGYPLTVEGKITEANIRYGKKKVLTLTVSDQRSSLKVALFHYSSYQVKLFKIGVKVRCFGAIKTTPFGLEMVHPEVKLASECQGMESTYTPFYPATEGVGQMLLRRCARYSLDKLNELSASNDFDNELAKLMKGNFLDSLNSVHAPRANNDIALWNEGQHPEQFRLIQEEIVAYQLSLKKLKLHVRDVGAPSMSKNTGMLNRFVKSLPFTPTGAQQRVIAEVQEDLAMSKPMLRLVQGDVGSGKTLVAAMACVGAFESGFQVGLMAPTEILAEQHVIGFKEWFEPLGIKVGMLSGKQKSAERKLTLAQLSSGELNMVIGTHAIFQESVVFDSLGLVIIDEQHRFGVHQRLALKEKGVKGLSPHQLIMTATPIPRTLAMVSHADLDTSIIDELPPGRTPVKTVAIPDTRRDQVIERIKHVCEDENRQVYWVCTLIDESEFLDSQAAEDTCSMLQQLMPKLKVGLVHGRLNAQEKKSVMDAFKSGDVDVLVATTVIEVGVNVPNASLMVIENPERLGLAQLHQLRGRVGRGSVASHCILLYRSPLSAVSQERLGVLRDSNDGFVVAEKDLELRGAGDVLGTKQTGAASFRLADLERDAVHLGTLQVIADNIWENDTPISEWLIRRWGFDIDKYASV
jgi:ATP-dependent DNA helicase RecG